MKKFSKKLFCLMLVAIMVATAIPFGVFADDPSHTDREGHTGANAVWVYDSTRADEITATSHPVKCNLCGYEDTQYSHTPGADGKCTMCGYDSNPTYYLNVTGALGTHTKEFDNGLPGLTFDAALNWVGLDATNLKIHAKDTHMGEGYYYQDSYDAASHTRTITITTDEHDPVITGKTADGSKHIVKCKISGCDYQAEEGHTYDPATGVCACGAKDASKKFNYSVAIKTTGGLQLAESKTVSMTEAEADAVKTNAKQAIEANFRSVYNDLTISTLDTAAASVNHETRTILLTVDKQEPPVSHENEIQVVYDDGTVTYIPRKVGSWYFSTSNLGLDDTWGTTQAKLKIYDANGSRNVLWDSEDNDAFVKATDYKVEVLGINRTVTIYFMKTSTANPTTTDAFATKYYEANTRLGVLPSLPDGYTGWYVGQEELTVDTVYHWKEKSVYAYPGKGVGSGRVHLFIYNKDNQLMKNVDVTENVQDNGLITKTGLMNTIEYQTGRKNPTVAGLFDESGWAYYLNNKNSTAKAKSSVDVGRAADRQGTQNIYVVLTNVSGGSNADTSNPKTGDTAMIGTAAIVMALAAVGMGTAFYMKKKELF